MTKTPLYVIGALCSALTTMTACSDGATVTTSSVGPVSSPTTTVSMAPASTPGAVVGIEVPPCGLISAVEVAAATGLDVEEVIEESPTTCVFDLGVEAGVDVFITVDDGRGSLTGPAALFEGYADLIEAGEAEAIDGLGADAVYAPGFRGIAVDAGGGRFIGLGINGSYQQLQDPRRALVSLAAAALARL